MKQKKIIVFLFSIMASMSIISCVEELDILEATGDNGKNFLVVEATFNDQLKQQKVYLSRSEIRFDIETDTVYSYVYPLGIGSRDSVNVEQNARVKVIGDDGSTFDFFETEPGTYLSEKQFALQQNLQYRLEIETSDGTEYISEPSKIEATSNIEDVLVERSFNDLGVEGVQISVNSKSTNGNPNKYRFTYEETFKIIVPKWNSQDFLLENYDPCGSPLIATYDLSIINREVENKICYKTVPSNTIIQSNITDSQSNLNRFPVRFISGDNFIISHRYSILIQQHVQSLDSYLFYDTLKKFSESESVFSQIQPGALQANVFRKDGQAEMVLGFVEAVSTSEKRIYFNNEDLFPAEELPPFPYDCAERARHEGHQSYCLIDFHFADQCPPSIVELVNSGLISFTGLNDEELTPCPNQFFGLYGPYTFVFRVCGDCTVLGEIEPPDFWVE